MNIYQYNGLRIEVFDDPAFTSDSADNKNSYLHHYFGEGAKDLPISNHGIKVYKEEEEIASCIVIASAGETGIHENSSLLSNDQLLICCCDTVFCLSLPQLHLNWSVRCDMATCFQIFSFEEDYLIHGEIQITRIDKAGHIKWQFSGADIFVTVRGLDSFKLYADHIQLLDFNEFGYKIDFEGQPFE